MLVILTFAVAMSIRMLNAVTMGDRFVAYLNAKHSIGDREEGGTLISERMDDNAEHVYP